MNSNSWLVKNNRISAPIIATIASLVVWYASLYTFSDLIFLIPVVIFIVFHFTGLWRIKMRLLGGAIVLIAFMLIAGAIVTGVTVSSQPDYTYNMVHISGTVTGKSSTNVTLSVTPFAGQTGPYQYKIIVNSSEPVNYSSLQVNITSSGNSTAYKIVHYSNMTKMSNLPSPERGFTFTEPSFPAGIYTYNVSMKNSTTVIYTTPVEGPLTASPYSIYLLVVISDYLIAVLILYVIFAVGVFLARSIGKSRAPPQNPAANQTPNTSSLQPPLNPPRN